MDEATDETLEDTWLDATELLIALEAVLELAGDDNELVVADELIEEYSFAIPAVGTTITTIARNSERANFLT